MTYHHACSFSSVPTLNVVLCSCQPLTEVRTTLKGCVEVYHITLLQNLATSLSSVATLNFGLAFVSTPNTNENHA